MPDDFGASRGSYRPQSGSSGHSQVSSISGGSKVKNAEISGVNFIGGLDRRYLCPVCSSVLRFPVQFDECGHRVCSSCLPELLRVAPRCPIDQVKIERERVFVDKSFQAEIDALRVKCTNEARGCQWIGNFKELQIHIEDCRYGTCPCPRHCGVDLERRFVQKHLDEDCVKRGVKCEFCQAEISFEDEIDHYNTCSKFRVPCPNGCKMKEIPREQVEQHLATECPKQKIPCPFADAGCDFRAERKQMEKHLQEDPAGHLSKLCDLVMRTRIGMEEQMQVVKKVDTRLQLTEKRVDHLEKIYGSQLIWKVDGYTEKLNEAKAGTKPTIFIPPFLTSRHGYKLALSACLYGDGKARGKNMSIFCCVCKGEFDALLQWPFSHRVSFTLLDQALDPSARRNVSYSIKPNTSKENKPFLGRPVGERNASFGAQKFCELEVLNTRDYIRDDTIFIKVDVDSDEMVEP